MALKSHLAHAKQLYNDFDKNVVTTLDIKKPLSGKGNHNHRYEENFPFDVGSMWYSHFDPKNNKVNWVESLADLSKSEEVKTVVDFNRYFYLLCSRPLNLLFSPKKSSRAFIDKEELVLAVRNEYFFIYSVIHPEAIVKKAYLNLFMINPYLKRGGFGGAVLKWYEQYVRENFGIDYIYLVPLKREGVDDAYTYWNKMGFDYVKDPILMSKLYINNEGDRARIKNRTKSERPMPSTTTYPHLNPGPDIIQVKQVYNEPERYRAQGPISPGDRVHKVTAAGEKNQTQLWSSSSMWKDIRINPVKFEGHDNKKFESYLKAVPTTSVSEDALTFTDFHYSVDIKSETLLKKTDGALPLESSDEYKSLRLRMECESMPILISKLNATRGIQTPMTDDSKKCEEMTQTGKTLPTQFNPSLIPTTQTPGPIQAPPVPPPIPAIPAPTPIPAVPVPPPTPPLPAPTPIPAVPVPPPIPALPIPPPIPALPREPTLPEDLFELSNESIQAAIQNRRRQRENTPRPPPELIDLTLDEEENEPPARRRKIAQETEAEAVRYETRSNAAASPARPATRSNAAASPASAPPEINNIVFDMEGARRVARAHARYVMLRKFQRSSEKKAGMDIDVYIQLHIDEYNAAYESKLAQMRVSQYSRRR